MTKTNRWSKARLLSLLAFLTALLLTTECAAGEQKRTAPVTPGTRILPQAALAAKYFGPDAPWYQANIPFFDCADPELTQVYYYRWQLYKSHLKDLGRQGYIVTEFLDDVDWAKSPEQSLNDATAFHIHEGRWLRDPRYVNDYMDDME